jgi:hypothetical protein
MEDLLLLVMAGLLVAMAMIAALWVWRRTSGTTSLATAARDGMIALRAPGRQLASGDDDTDENTARGSASPGSTLGVPDGAATDVFAEPPPTGSQTADRAKHAPAEIKAPEVFKEEEEHEKQVQPGKLDSAIPPLAPLLVQDAAAPASSLPGNDKSESGEADLSECDGSEPLAKTSDLSARLKADAAVALRTESAADHETTSPALDLANTAEIPGDVTEAAAEGANDLLEECFAHDLPTPEQVESLPDAGPSLSPSVGENAAAENAAFVEAELNPEAALESPAAHVIHSRERAVYRDRRGKRRTPVTNKASLEPGLTGPTPVMRSPAEARLRLSLHPIRRVARLSVVLTRPDGFPARVTILEAGGDVVEAYDEQRYDDLDLPWTSELLEGELRFTSAEGFQWLRSARRVHIFAQDPDEPELISTSAARAGIAHTVICRSGDAEAVRLAAAATGSTELQTHEHWQGIPDGWLVLSGYAPAHVAAPPLPTAFRTMDPGEGLEISFNGGLVVRGHVYAAGHPPRIIITPAPGAASVTIGGMPAKRSSDGAWLAPGWDGPGRHMVDIVPGPSASYGIAPDPWLSGGWDFWDAHPERFGGRAAEPWARARICGALIRGPADEIVFASETQPTLVALGARSGATPLRRRADAAVSVSLMTKPPAFLLSTTGSRRSQGRVVWLGLVPVQNPCRRYDPEWVAIVRSAAARRLPLVQSDAAGEEAWRKAKERARRLRNRSPRA